MSEIFNIRKIVKENNSNGKLKRNCVTPRCVNQKRSLKNQEEKIELNQLPEELNQLPEELNQLPEELNQQSEENKINLNEVFEEYSKIDLNHIFEDEIPKINEDKTEIININIEENDGLSEESYDSILNLSDDIDSDLVEKINTNNNLNKKMLSVLFDDKNMQKELRKKINKSGFGLIR